MAEALIIIALLAVLWILATKSTTRSESEHSRQRGQVRRHAKRADALLSVLRNKTLDLGLGWRLEPASEKQIRYLSQLADDEGISIPRSLTKGQASDAIGLFQKAEAAEIAQLKFFKVPNPGKLNQTEARTTLHQLLSNPENRERWENRPATVEQKDQLRFFGGKVSKGLTFPQAKRIIDQLVESNDQLLDRWFELRNAYDEAVDPEVRDLYDVKRFSWKQFCNAIEKLEDAGKQLSDIILDEETIYETLLREHPKLAK